MVPVTTPPTPQQEQANKYEFTKTIQTHYSKTSQSWRKLGDPRFIKSETFETIGDKIEVGAT